MRIITITSDWNDDDYYVAALKGRILSGCPEARIIDISHRVQSFNIAQAAFILRNAVRNYPEGSVHIMAVNTEPSPDTALLAAQMAGQYFIGADNGFLGLLGDPGPQKVIRVLESEAMASSFISLAVFSELACALASGKRLESLGEAFTDFKRQVPMRPTLEDNAILGSVIHVDSFENTITNISREFFEHVGKGRKYRIYLQSKHYVIEKISRAYHDVEKGDYLAIWNSLDLLEIAIREGKAAGLLNLGPGSSIKVEFKEA